jgi:hypothetical protein
MRVGLAFAAIGLAVACGGGDDAKPAHLAVTLEGIVSMQYDLDSRTCVHAPEGSFHSAAYDAGRGQEGTPYLAFAYLRHDMEANEAEDPVQITAFEVSPVEGGVWSGLPHEPAVRVTAVLRAGSAAFIPVSLISPQLAEALIRGTPEKPSPVGDPGESFPLLIQVRGLGTAADGSPVTTNAIQFPVSIHNDRSLDRPCSTGEHPEGCVLQRTQDGTFPVQSDGWICMPD